MATPASLVGEHCLHPWREIAAVCHDAAVFVDDGAGELLHWAGGLALLEGCIGVYDLFGELSPVARDFIAKVGMLIETYNHIHCSLLYIINMMVLLDIIRKDK